MDHCTRTSRPDHHFSSALAAVLLHRLALSVFSPTQPTSQPINPAACAGARASTDHPSSPYQYPPDSTRTVNHIPGARRPTPATWSPAKRILHQTSSRLSRHQPSPHLTSLTNSPENTCTRTKHLSAASVHLHLPSYTYHPDPRYVPAPDAPCSRPLCCHPCDKSPARALLSLLAKPSDGCDPHSCLAWTGRQGLVQLAFCTCAVLCTFLGHCSVCLPV